MKPWAIALMMAACVQSRALSLKPAFAAGLKFSQPLGMLQAPDGAMLVLEQRGTVQRLAPGAAAASPFIDLRSRVRLGSEEGLLSLALHPRFNENRLLYIVYSLKGASPRRTRLSRFKALPGLAQADPSSEHVLFEVTKKHGNHNGATLLFGPDSALYLSLGDGGGAGDRDGNAQNPKSFLGKILRFQLKDGGGLGKPEIYALGLRNPWRMSFDSKTGELWAGDVGQDKWEEVDLIVKGGNYGWNLREGSHPYLDQGEARPGLIEPLLDYGRGDGFCITGGYVYRGSQIPGLQGSYVFGDFGSRKIWAWNKGEAQKRFLVKAEEGISSFAQDRNGELYVIGYDGTVFSLTE